MDPPLDTVPTVRPVTSKPRGICKYYNTSRGCYAGNQCKFLHGSTERLTPYDKSKVCKFYAAGYCKNGDKCWFIHADPSKPSEEEICTICYDKPITYGLLVNCSHIFCLPCIKNWRGTEGKSVDIIEAGTTKTCPMCRTPSRFVTPSSIFYPDGDPKKLEVIETYKNSMSRVKCRYFERSKPGKRFCPLGDDCFYKHEEVEGVRYKFNYSADELAERRRNRRLEDDLLRDDHFVDDFEAMFEAIARVFGDAHMSTRDMQRAVLSTVANIFGSDTIPPMLRLEEDSAEEEEPTLDPLTQSSAAPSQASPWTDWHPVESVFSPPSQEADLPTLASSAPTTDSPSQQAASTLNPLSPVFVPSFLDSLRPLPPGPSPSPSASNGVNDHLTLDPAPTWNVPSVQVSPASLPSADANDITAAADRDVAAVQDTDPPFMTDGRGRVVWSSTSPSIRGRDGRRARATSSSAAILPHSKSNIDLTAAEESPEESQDDEVGNRSSSASRRLVRQRSLPLVGSSTDSAACVAEFVTDGRGGVVFAMENQR